MPKQAEKPRDKDDIWEEIYQKTSNIEAVSELTAHAVREQKEYNSEQTNHSILTASWLIHDLAKEIQALFSEIIIMESKQ